MKIFIDSADIDEIKEAISWGIVDGITTNPSLIKKAALKHGTKDMTAYIAQIFEAAPNLPISLEVISLETDEIIAEGKKLFDIFKEQGNVIVKVPVNTAESISDKQFSGLQAIKKLSSIGIALNVTLIMTPEQALLAAKAGAKYVSPFAGRIDDHIRVTYEKTFEKTEYFEIDEKLHDKGIHSGIHLVENIRTIFDNYEFDCEIIAASLRNPRQVRECALVGSDIATIPFSVLKEMLAHKKTFEGVSAFKNDIVPEYKDVFE